MTPDWLLYLITDRRLTAPRPLIEVVAEALEGGVRAIQLREKDLSSPALLELAAAVRILTTRAGAALLINNRLDVALAVGADGVHLPADSLPIRAVRRILGSGKLIGVSTHSAAEVQVAAAGGADFVTFGPVFATPSKARYGPPLGLAALAQVCRTSPIPVFGVGGITPERTPSVMGAGARGVAVIAAIISSRDIRSATHACLEAVRASRERDSVDPTSAQCYN